MYGAPYREYTLNPSNQASVFGAGFLERREASFSGQVSEQYHCHVILAGQGLLIDDSLHSCPLTAGCVFQQFPGKAYTLYVDTAQSFTEFQLTLSSATLDALRTISRFHEGAPVFQIQMYPHLRQWMHDMTLTASTSPPALLLEAYFELQRLLLTIHMQEENDDYAYALSLIRFASHYTMDHLETPLSVQTLADACKVSYSRLSQVFKAYTQMTPLKYLQHYKFCYADRLLHEGRSIQEVAGLLGYSDQFAFSKQFKRSMGISPSIIQRSRSPLPDADSRRS